MGGAPDQFYDLIQHPPVETQHFIQADQQPVFRRVQPVVGESGLDLDFHEHPQQGGPAVAFPAELIHYRYKVEFRFLAAVEQGPGQLALLLAKLHLAHEGIGEIDLIPCNAAI